MLEQSAKKIKEKSEETVDIEPSNNELEFIVTEAIAEQKETKTTVLSETSIVFDLWALGKFQP